METHNFRLILNSIPSLEKADALYSLFNDGTYEIVNGVAEIWFDRNAKSLEEAIASAIADVKSGGLEVRKVEIEPDGFPTAVVA